MYKESGFPASPLCQNAQYKGQIWGNSKHFAHLYGTEAFLVAILFFGYHFLVKWQPMVKIYLHAKFWASSLKIKRVMPPIRNGELNV